jgi:hypothetical protein
MCSTNMVSSFYGPIRVSAIDTCTAPVRYFAFEKAASPRAHSSCACAAVHHRSVARSPLGVCLPVLHWLVMLRVLPSLSLAPQGALQRSVQSAAFWCRPARCSCRTRGGSIGVILTCILFLCPCSLTLAQARLSPTSPPACASLRGRIPRGGGSSPPSAAGDTQVRFRQRCLRVRCAPAPRLSSPCRLHAPPPSPRSPVHDSSLPDFADVLAFACSRSCFLSLVSFLLAVVFESGLIRRVCSRATCRCHSHCGLISSPVQIALGGVGFLPVSGVSPGRSPSRFALASSGAVVISLSGASGLMSELIFSPLPCGCPGQLRADFRVH